MVSNSVGKWLTTGVGIALIAGILGGAPSAAIAQDAPAPTPWKYYPAQPEAPRGAPNILLIMTDDIGFSASASFGGAIPTPTFDELGQEGLRYNEFNTTAMCSPSRAALLTGRNHHAVGYGAIANLSTDEPGYTSVIPKSAATIGRVLQMNGYDTAWVGKNHNTPVWETGPTGPFDHWPNAMGFDYFYGFNAAATDQYAPDLVENRNPIDPPKSAAYNLDRDLSDHLLHWLQIHHNVRPDRPFFAYWSPGTLHSPHGAPADWIARFKGKFDQGWDKLREETFKRQKKLGIIPADAVLTARPPGMPAWDSLTPEQQHAASRQMEVAAAQLAQCDYQIGRVVDWLKKTGQFENTLIIFIQGDNGASDEDLRGNNDELATLIGIEPTWTDVVQGIGRHGEPDSYSNYAAGWAWATNTPFQWGKEIASHLGGLRDGLAITWPDRIKSAGIRDQFSHLIDIAPTIYEAAGITPPAKVDGVIQQPIDGTSMVYTFNHPDAPTRHTQQYFEMLGNRAYYDHGWMASTIVEVAPWDRKHAPVDPYKFKWALYNLHTDFSQGINVADKYPAKLAQLQHEFDVAAKKYHVYPLGKSVLERLKATNRPNPLNGRTHFAYYPGDTRYSANSFPSVRPGWLTTAHLQIGASTARGAILVMGDHESGLGLTLEDGIPSLLYNPSGRRRERVVLTGRQPLEPGAHSVAVHLAATPDKGARAGTITLSVDGSVVDSAAVPTLYPILGATYVGRPGIRDLLAGRNLGALNDAVLTELDVDLKQK